MVKVKKILDLLKRTVFSVKIKRNGNKVCSEKEMGAKDRGKAYCFLAYSSTSTMERKEERFYKRARRMPESLNNIIFYKDS